jgi:hydroxymethylpyrimidine pyrophosphatase-like HAD family hydrolase
VRGSDRRFRTNRTNPAGAQDARRRDPTVAWGRISALATDLDRTLIRPGTRPGATAQRALQEAQELGLRTLLVSGRSYSALIPYARTLGHLDSIVAENGAVVEAPVGSRPTIFGARKMAEVRRRVGARPDLRAEFGVVIFSVPRSEGRRLRSLVSGLPVQVVANVGSLNIGPAGVSKRSGIRLALHRLGLARANYAAIGDAENDLEMLRDAELSGAVANAVPSVRVSVDYRCRARYARGVLEFVRGPVARYG